MQVGARELRNNVSECLSKVAFGKERLVVTRNGKAVAALVPLEDLDTLEALEDRIDLQEARKALAEAEVEGFVDWDELRSELRL
jgi:prevent-host-death family protein